MKHIKIMRTISAVILSVLLIFCFSLSVFAVEYDCSAGRHKYTVKITAATADKDGEERYTCELCGYSYKEVLLATEHTWSDWVIDKQPTCTGEGLKHHTCNRGTPHTEEEIIPAAGHDYAVSKKEPTCLKRGMKTFTCKKCGDTYTETYGKASGHQYTEQITTPPEYGKEGVKTFTCERCGVSYTKPIAALTAHEHTYIIQSDIKVTCETDGVRTYICSFCGDTYSENIPALGHSWGQWTVDKKPNLTAEGHQHKICANDSTHVIEEAMPKAITWEITPLDAVIGAVNLGVLSFFASTLLADLYVIRWDTRKRNMLLKHIKGGRLQR